MLNFASLSCFYSKLRWGAFLTPPSKIGGPNTPSKIGLTISYIKILGVTFTYNKALAQKENFYALSLDCRKLLNMLKQRWLSLSGIIQVFKSLARSKLMYFGTVIDSQQNFLDTIKTLHKDFIWSLNQTLNIDR